jgi:hypothetical protein
MFQNVPRIILEGAKNVLGPSGIFWEETVAENILSQREGTRSHDSWAILLGRPFGGQPMFGGFLGREHPCLVEHVWWGWGPPWGLPKRWPAMVGRAPMWGFSVPMFSGFL